MIKKIILFYPSTKPDFNSKDLDFEIPAVPIGIMSLAAFMRKHGFEVVIIDSRIYDKDDARKRLHSEIEGSEKEVIVGFSVTTSQIKHAYMLSKEVKERFPEAKVVWGGIHPTLYPEQTIESDYIDFLIINEGECGLLGLVSQLNSKNEDFTKITNLVYKRGNKIHMNPQTAVHDINELPMPSYNLLDIDNYLNRELYFYDINKKVKSIDINTSRGCPYRCAFCTNTLPGFKRWRPLSSERVNEVMDYVIKNYGIKHIWFMDDYFFGSKERIVNILNHMIKKKYRITWEGNARANLFDSNYFTLELLSLMKKSGCVQLRMGIESGSARVLKILKKDITVENAMNAAAICRKWGIRSDLYFMGGIPGETRKELYETIDLMVKLKDINPDSIIQGPALFRPYPGTELYAECKKKGFKEPKTLEEWMRIELTNNYGIDYKDIKWVDFGEEVTVAEMAVFNYMYGRSHIAMKKKMSFARQLLYNLAKIRIKTHFFRFPFERMLFRLKKYLELKLKRKIN